MDHEAEAHRTDLMTITRYVLNEQSRHPESRGDFSILLSHIVLGCKFVCSSVNKVRSFPLLFFDHLLIRFFVLISFTPLDLSNLAALPVSGKKEAISRSHKSVLLELKGFGYFMHTSLLYLFHIGTQLDSKKLDVLSNEVFVKALISSGRTLGIHVLIWIQSTSQCILVSEEDEEATFVDPPLRGRFVFFITFIGCCYFDQIFGVYMVKDKDDVTLDEVLQPGKNMLAAGYCMYGSSCTVNYQMLCNLLPLYSICKHTFAVCHLFYFNSYSFAPLFLLMQLVLSTGSGVNGFTLDPSLGEFILTHPDIKIRRVQMGNY
ncbi:hypothetical protein BHM03_00058278, partial [Ensete ventricosum]